MKQLLLALTLISNSAIAQDSLCDLSASFPKHEINIGLTNLLQKQNVYVNTNPPYLFSSSYAYSSYYVQQPIAGVGIGYKFNINNKHGIRVLFGYKYSRDNSSSNNSSFDNSTFTNSWENEYLFSELDLRLGYQYRMELGGRFYSYFGAESIVKSSEGFTKQKNSSETYNEFTGETEESSSSSENKQKNSSIGGAPFFGIQFFITPKLSLSLETKVDMVSTTYERSGLSEHSNTGKRELNQTGTRTDIQAIPLGFFSINAHF